MARMHRLLVVLPVVALTALLVPMLAHAQGSPAAMDGLRFTTGFPFMIDDVTVPAGSYTVRRTGPNPVTLELTNNVTLRRTLVAVRQGNVPRHAPYDAGVAFERRGTAYVLGGFWDVAINAGVDTIRPSHVERPDVKTAQASPEYVLIRASRR